MLSGRHECQTDRLHATYPHVQVSWASDKNEACSNPGKKSLGTCLLDRRKRSWHPFVRQVLPALPMPAAGLLPHLRRCHGDDPHHNVKRQVLQRAALRPAQAKADVLTRQPSRPKPYCTWLTAIPEALQDHHVMTVLLVPLGGRCSLLHTGP